LPGRIGTDVIKKTIERVARPETAVEDFSLKPRLAVNDDFLNDDRP
jgi:hypothetical protein